MTNTPSDPNLTPAAEAVLNADRLAPEPPRPTADPKVLRALIALLVAAMATLAFFFAYELVDDSTHIPKPAADITLDVRTVTLPDGTDTTCVIAPRAMDCEFPATWGN